MATQEKNLGGSPPLYATAEDLSESIERYFTYIKGEFSGKSKTKYVRQPEPATITGLALFLGFESRQSIYDYQERGKFSYIIKNARLRVECEYEKRLSGNLPTGPIFALKNMGWKDKVDTEHSGSIGIVWQEVKNYGTDNKTDGGS
jgi:hypothetical protein